MKKFRIVRDPIELVVEQVVQLTNERNEISGERRIILDNNAGAIWAYEGWVKEEYFKIGDLVKYNVCTDDFRKFNPHELPPYSTLFEIE
jgi:hypothetical protein